MSTCYLDSPYAGLTIYQTLAHSQCFVHTSTCVYQIHLLSIVFLNHRIIWYLHQHHWNWCEELLLFIKAEKSSFKTSPVSNLKELSVLRSSTLNESAHCYLWPASTRYCYHFHLNFLTRWAPLAKEVWCKEKSKILWFCFWFLNAGCLESRHNASTTLKNPKLPKTILKIKGSSQLRTVPLGKGPTRDAFHSDLELCQNPSVPFARFYS